MPPDPTETPSEAAQAQATAQPTNQEHPRRPQSQEAKRGQAAATRSDGRKPGETGTRDTHSANQPKTRDHPNERTTDRAEGNGPPAEEEQPTTRQRYEKPRHPQHRPTPKKAAPTPKKAAPTPKKDTPKPQKKQRRNRHTEPPKAEPTPEPEAAGREGTRPNERHRQQRHSRGKAGPGARRRKTHHTKRKQKRKHPHLCFIFLGGICVGAGAPRRRPQNARRLIKIFHNARRHKSDFAVSRH